MITKFFNQGKQAFTLTELVVVIGILAIFSGIAIANFNRFSTQGKVENEVKKFIDVLDLAKNKASAEEIPTGCIGQFLGYQIRILNTGRGYELRGKCQGNPGMYFTVQSYAFDPGVKVSTSIYITVDYAPLNAGVFTNPDRAFLFTNTDSSKCYSVSVNSVGTVTDIPVNCSLPI